MSIAEPYPKQFVTLKPAQLEYLTGDFPPPVVPVFNNWGVIVGTAGRGTLNPDVAFALETKYRFAQAYAIHELHQWFINRQGFNPLSFPASITPDGSCNPEAKQAGHCHPLFGAKDVCAGCGKSWLAGSYYQPSRCKPQVPTQWQTNMKDYIARVITANGGVSKTAPLVTIQFGGARRQEPYVRR